MPLLNICSITGHNMVIQIGLIFLSSEKEADYNWATKYLRGIMAENSIQEPYSIVTDRELALIRSLSTTFPSSQHLLCRWHVNMNVLAKTKRFFPSPTRVNGKLVRHPRFQEFLQAWNTLLASPSEEEYNRQLAVMQTSYPQDAMKYCTDTWLIWKEHIVACWINQYPHFGVTVTSPIEGCHATLKAYLQRGHSDLKGIFMKLQLFWTAQHATIQSTTAQHQIRLNHAVNTPLLGAISGQVHRYALKKILQEQSKLPAKGPPTSICSCSIQKAFGLPCYHKIWERKVAHSVIQVEDIHPHWFFQRPEPGISLQLSHPLPVLNPVTIQGRGRPRGALGSSIRPTTTRRDPSAFEIPSSSAPPILNRPSERLYIVNPGLTRLDNGHQDLYEPGTERERAYMRGLSSIYQVDTIADSATSAAELIEGEVIDCIEVDTSI
jgi:MULE transposase domain